MKKCLLSTLAIMLIFSGSSFAQGWSAGVKAGATFATVNGVQAAKTRTGVMAGAFVERSINNWFSVQTELLWSQQGFKQNLANQHYKTHLNYINMPVITKYYMVGGLNLQLGAQFGYLVTAEERGAARSTLKTAINKFNSDIVVGLAYDFCFGMIIEGRYCMGLNNLQNIDMGQQLRNSTLQVGLGWRF